MKKWMMLPVLLQTMVVMAQEPLKVKLYPEGAPSANGLEGRPEGVNGRGALICVSDPELWVYLPHRDIVPTQAMLVVAGGAYRGIAMSHEGIKTAEWLTKHGIAAIVLKYRLPNGHPKVVVDDGRAAMRMIRKRAGEWGIRLQSLGAIGFSAGGHFVSTLVTRFTAPEERPDFAVLVYPVISMYLSNAGTGRSLLGVQADSVLLHRYSSSHQVTRNTPPVCLVLCDDDRAVPPANSIEFYTALKKHQVPAEMHIFPKGQHGWWMRESYPYAEETYALVLRWIRSFAE